MLLTEFDEKLWEKGVREEERNIGREEGRKEGREEAQAEIIRIYVEDQLEEHVSPEKIKIKLVSKYGQTDEGAEAIVKGILDGKK